MKIITEIIFNLSYYENVKNEQKDLNYKRITPTCKIKAIKVIKLYKSSLNSKKRHFINANFLF